VTALAVEGLVHAFGGLRALDGLSLTAEVGERLVVLGPNGAGKTTLFNAVTGLVRPAAGRIRLFGRDVTRLPAYRRARLGLGRSFQVALLFPRLTVRESARLALHAADGARLVLHRPAPASGPLAERAERLLAEWGLADQADVPCERLSYGAQRQVELALALAGRPRVLLLDEPTAGLSPAETQTVAAMIGRFPRDLTLLLIEHDLDVALALADRVVVLHQGRLLAEGDRAAIQADPRVAAIYLGPGD
jgi:branched-chain amino acid transport system ATP-binding protein